MKTLFAIILVLAAAVVTAVLLRQDPGYVVIAIGVWTLETSLAVSLVALFVAFVFLYIGVRFVVRLWAAPSEVLIWKEERKGKKAQQTLINGLILMAEGNWDRSEKMLLKRVKHSPVALINYLAAARCAQMKGEHERRDFYLKQAYSSQPDAKIAVSLTQAELQIAHKQMEHALATLNHLRSLAPNHAYVLKLLTRLYLALNDWPQLEKLLPELAQNKAMGKEELRSLEIKTFSALIEQPLTRGQTGKLQGLWDRVPRGLRLESSLLASYVKQLITTGASSQAESLLVRSLNRAWDDDLAYLYGVVEGRNLGEQLARAEGWLKTHPHNSILLLSLGRLCLRHRLWGKSRIYLESSLSLDPTSEAQCELGGLLERLGETDRAIDCYRKGISGAAVRSQRSRLGIEFKPVQVLPPATESLVIIEEEQVDVSPEEDKTPEPTRLLKSV